MKMVEFRDMFGIVSVNPDGVQGVEAAKPLSCGRPVTRLDFGGGHYLWVYGDVEETNRKLSFGRDVGGVTLN